METTDQTTDQIQEPSTDETPKAPAPPIKSRFLFVDVSAGCQISTKSGSSR